MSNKTKRRPPLRRTPVQARPVSETTTAQPAPVTLTEHDPARRALEASMHLSGARRKLLRAEGDLTTAIGRCVAAGVSDAEMARVLHISRQAVRARRLALLGHDS